MTIPQIVEQLHQRARDAEWMQGEIERITKQRDEARADLKRACDLLREHGCKHDGGLGRGFRSCIDVTGFLAEQEGKQR